MNKHIKFKHRITIKSTIWTAVVLMLVVGTLVACVEVASATRLANSTMNALKQQCVSFNRLVASDRIKSLYRLSDMMLELSEDIKRNPSIATDEYLEKYVDNLRLSGVALLDENGKLKASGYTRQFRQTDWENSPDGSRFADILQYRDKVYMERIELNGEYYDVTAVAREDTSGILVGFYHQPSGLIADTEKDLKSLLSGLKLERDGHYIIAENGVPRSTSDGLLSDLTASDKVTFQNLSLVPKDGKLHWIHADSKHYWGCHSGCENYSLYVYYPVTSVFSSTIAIVAIVMSAYCVLSLLYFAVRNQALYENQEELRRSNSSLTQTVKMLKALETIYFSLFYVDLKSGNYDTIYIAPWLKESIPKSGSFKGLKKLFLDDFIVPSFHDSIETHLSISYIQENLNQRNLSDVYKSFYVDYQAIRGDKTPWCRVSATPVDFDETGNPIHILALIQDIDIDKAREADYQARIIKEANQAKIANNAKSDFLRRISHDIRTPINGIQGYINMANKHPEDAKLQEHCRNNIVSTMHILMELVNSILDMGDLESNEIVLEEKPFDLTKLLDNANTVLIPLANEKNVNYEIVRTSAVPVTHLIGSPRHLGQVIMNLTSNAVKYTNPGGYVRVNTCLVSRTENTVTYAFICEDNGIGMSQEFQSHMYEPFVQESSSARTTYEGVGLGLSIVKKLVDAMGGTLTCISEKDKGTIFRTELTFKIDAQSNQQTEQVPLKPTSKTDITLDGVNVLLVEDNELNMEISECLLLEQGAKITKVWNGKEAVDTFAASEVNSFDLILMDIMMPEMDGREATRAIRAMNRSDAKSIPILAVSANCSQADIQKNRSVGMNGLIMKPIDPEKLKVALSEFCPNNK